MNQSRCSKCCEDFNINPLHLVMPHLMGPDGREFVEAHGIDLETLSELRAGAVLMDNGEVKIKHRCEQLTDDGLCGIYDARPKICRDFDCRLKTECINDLPQGAIRLQVETVDQGGVAEVELNDEEDE